MPFVALSRSRAFLLLLVVLLQLGLAPAVPGGCPAADDVPMPCCACAVSAGQMMGCHDKGDPATPAPGDEDPDCPCTIDVDPTPPPSPWTGPTTDSSPIAGLDRNGGDAAPRLSLRGRERHTPPRAGVGPPIYRLYCALLI